MRWHDRVIGGIEFLLLRYRTSLAKRALPHQEEQGKAEAEADEQRSRNADPPVLDLRPRPLHRSPYEKGKFGGDQVEP